MILPHATSGQEEAWDKVISMLIQILQLFERQSRMMGYIFFIGISESNKLLAIFSAKIPFFPHFFAEKVVSERVFCYLCGVNIQTSTLRDITFYSFITTISL